MTYAGFRLTDRVQRFLEARRRGKEALGKTARRFLEWSVVLFEEGENEVHRSLSEPEITQILEALPGSGDLSPEMASVLWALLAQRFGEDHPIVQKVRALSSPGRLALADLLLRRQKA